VFKAWYVLGKLGAFNDSRLQVAEHAIATVHAISHMPYRVATKAEEPCYFHAMGDCEFKGNWMRCWCDAVARRGHVLWRGSQCRAPRVAGSTWARRMRWRWTC
jgi:hypothetical protein